MDLCEVRLVYTARSRPARNIQLDPVREEGEDRGERRRRGEKKGEEEEEKKQKQLFSV